MKAAPPSCSLLFMLCSCYRPETKRGRRALPESADLLHHRLAFDLKRPLVLERLFDGFDLLLQSITLPAM